MTPPLWTSSRTGSAVWQADALDVAAGLPEGCASLAVLDGPYGVGRAEWDRIPRGGCLADLYRPHLEAVGRVCGLSATVYVWNTAAGWAELHAEMLQRGWAFASLIVWDKGDGFMAGKCDVKGLRGWYDVTEVCGVYQREAWAPAQAAGATIAYAAGADARNWIRPWLADEWRAAGLRNADADRVLGTRGMAGHYFGASQWALPTWEAYQTLAAEAQRVGPARARPYFCLDGLTERASYDHLRAEYEASRPAFACPLGVSNVWRAPTVAGAERLRGPGGQTLHPCQKPLAFAERIIRASSRPGDTVWVPFGGTLRELVAAEQMARAEPAEARRVLTCELNADGVDYIGPALAQADGRGLLAPGQVGLFGGAR